ncbi:MAG: hypothetical protein M5U28_40950 [Sandaracinaceae bacterium]|nr:hypothetical protein [Sandaracinaceae bacterium]
MVSAVNLVWSVAEAWQTADFMVSTAFVFFNAVMFSGFIALGAGDERRLLQYTGWSCALSLIAQYGLSLLFPELAEGARLEALLQQSKPACILCSWRNDTRLRCGASMRYASTAGRSCGRRRRIH